MAMAARPLLALAVPRLACCIRRMAACNTSSRLTITIRIVALIPGLSNKSSLRKSDDDSIGRDVLDSLGQDKRSPI